MKVLIVTTIPGTVNAFLIPHIKLLVDQGHRVDVAFSEIGVVYPEIREMVCKIHNINFQRSPLKKENFFACIKMKKLIKKEKYDLVHTHTPIASFISRLATIGIPNLKTIYTAHGFHFYKGAPLKNWLIYYPIERILAYFTDVLITINKEDYKRASKSFKAKKVLYVRGVGLNIEKFNLVSTDKFLKRKEIGVPKDAFLILSVGELNENKNHEIIIRAIAHLKNPNIYYIICGNGILTERLRNLSEKYKIKNNVILLGNRIDIPEICNTADLFAFPSFREGLSVALMEAMASGLPVVCSDIRGNEDLIENEKGGFLIKPSDSEGFAKSINEILINSENTMGDINKKNIRSFYIDNILIEMKKIYSNI